MILRLHLLVLLSLLGGCAEPAFECAAHEECGSCGICQNGVCIRTSCPDDAHAGVDATADADRDAEIDAATDMEAGEPGASLSASPASYDFGPVVLGRRPARVITIQNDGDAAAELDAISLAPPFVVGTNDCSGAILVSGGACTVEVAFESVVLGDASSSLVLSAADGLGVEVPLRASAVRNAHLVFSPEELRFGSVPVGETASNQIVVRNAGEIETSDLSVQIGGAQADAFAIDGGCDLPALPPSATCTITVSYTPIASGTIQRATLLAKDARGAFGLGALAGNSVPPALLVARQSHLFVNAVVGTVRPLGIWLDNLGGAETGPLSRSISGPNAADLTIESGGCEGQSLAPGASCDFTLSFSPLAVGPVQAAIEIASPQGSVTVTIDGEGRAPPAPPIAIPSIVEFGDLVVGTASPWTYPEISYDGETSMGGFASISGPDAAEFRLVPNFCGGSPCGNGVEFRPTTTGTKAATLTAPLSFGTVNVLLSGGGIDASAMRFTPNQLFEVLPGTATRNYPLTLRNHGTSATAPISIQLSGSSDYAILSNTCNAMSLAPNGTCSVTVRLVPSSMVETHALLTASASAGLASVPLGYVINPPQVVLTARDEPSLGAGGRVTAPGLDCPTDCRAVFPASTPIQIAAIPEPNYVFTGWISGLCAINPCTIQPSSGFVDATPIFEREGRTLDVAIDGAGGTAGSVIDAAAGIACTGNCSYIFPHATMIHLVATAASGSSFSGWTGDCAGEGATCVVNLTDARAVRAQFSPNNLVFVTSTTVAIGSLANQFEADAECERAAAAAGAPGRYAAWISTGNIAALPRLAAMIPEPRGWVRPDGAPFAESIFDLLHERILFPPSLTELGDETAIDERIATGTYAGGDTALACFDWSSSTSVVQVGSPRAGSHGWTELDLSSCMDQTTHLYCFGIDYRAPIDVVPRFGDRTAFITSSTWDPSSGLAGADDLCQDEANFGGLLGQYTALLGTSTMPPQDRIALGPPYSRTDGVPIVDDTADLSAGLRAALTAETDGRTHAGDALVWTGASSSCADWTSSSSSDLGSVGIASLTTSAWIDAGRPALCSERHRLYCFER